MNADESMIESSSPSPQAGSNSHSSTPDMSSSASTFVRNAARKSLGNGLSMDRWFCAQEKVLEQHHQYEVSHCWLLAAQSVVISFYRAVNKVVSSITLTLSREHVSN